MQSAPDTLLMPAKTLALPGGIIRLLSEGAAFGRRCILVHGRSLSRSGALQMLLGAKPSNLRVALWEHDGGEPTLSQLSTVLGFARGEGADWVASVGGGSVLDLGKACAGLMCAPLPPVRYHDGAEVPVSRTPFLAVPTTAGTGSECTGVCVLTNEMTGVKKSFRHPSFMARVVILDAELLATCPTSVVAFSGMDAYAQAVESYVSTGGTLQTDAWAMEALRLVDSTLERVAGGEKGRAAEELLAGSNLAGLALANARLGIVHGLAHPLGSRYHVAHGLACAMCLGPALEFNREAMGDKYSRMSSIVGKDILQRVEELLKRLGLRSPFVGTTLPDKEAVIAETLASGSTAANPRKVDRKDVEFLLDQLLGDDI